jgi:dTDP-4-dehydrorhamnose 3,5-epimerase
MPKPVPTQFPSLTIAGIRVFRLQSHANERGFFREVLRKTWISKPIQQASLSQTNPGVIKAFHWHDKQLDIWHLVSGKALVVLHDARKKTKTAGKTEHFVWDSEKDSLLLVIPKKVLHGYKVLGEKPITMLYLMDKEYNAKKPDEKRVSFDDPKIGFDWSIEK